MTSGRDNLKQFSVFAELINISSHDVITGDLLLFSSGTRWLFTYKRFFYICFLLKKYYLKIMMYHFSWWYTTNLFVI